MATDASYINGLIGRAVVLDTAGPLTYLGILLEVSADGFLLQSADLRDRTEGHVSKERYICEAKERGIRVNRSNVFVLRGVVVSLSALDDVETDFTGDLD